MRRRDGTVERRGERVGCQDPARVGRRRGAGRGGRGQCEPSGPDDYAQDEAWMTHGGDRSVLSVVGVSGRRILTVAIGVGNYRPGHDLNVRRDRRARCCVSSSGHTSTTPMTVGRFSVEGDVILAARLEAMFGAA